jgi:hypothetical protein
MIDVDIYDVSAGACVLHSPDGSLCLGAAVDHGG